MIPLTFETFYLYNSTNSVICHIFNQPWEQNWQPHLIRCNWSKMHQAASLRVNVKQGKNPRDQHARILTRLRNQAFLMHNTSWWLETQFRMLDTKCWAVLHKFIDPFLFLRWNQMTGLRRLPFLLQKKHLKWCGCMGCRKKLHMQLLKIRASH